VIKNGFCYDCVLAPTKSNGYIQLSWNGANKFCTLGEMLGWAAGLRAKPLEQISHLCCNPKCTIPSHVIFESAAANNRRKGCKVWVDCPHKGCSEKIIVCDHSPSCIKYVPGYETWDEFLKWNAEDHNLSVL
jgi:Zinc-binding loop region of homing endonuclease